MGTIKFLNIGSGSKGNATFFYDGKTLIQIDMGLSLKSVKNGLGELGLVVNDIDALFITHNHDDHIKSVCRLKTTPIYARKDILPEDIKYIKIKPLEEIRIGDFRILPFNSSHDAPKSVNFVIYHNDTKIVFITDTGRIKKSAESLLYNANLYYFESNYDLDMLYNSGRPLNLIRRIEGQFGHLGNEQAGAYLSRFIGDKTQKVYLAHLSEECNKEEIALETVRRHFKENGIIFDESNLIATRQREITIGEINED